MNHKADDIFNAVCALTGFSAGEFVGPQGPIKLSNARAILVGVIRYYCTRLSFPEISRTYLGRQYNGCICECHNRWKLLPLIDRNDWLFRVGVLSEVAAANRAHEERQAKKIDQQLRWVPQTVQSIVRVPAKHLPIVRAHQAKKAIRTWTPTLDASGGDGFRRKVRAA